MDSRLMLLSAVVAIQCLLVKAAINRTYTPAETSALLNSYNNNKARFGPQKTCTGDGDCSSYPGTKCFGLTGCMYCICDPFEYDLSEARNLYSSSAKKCLKAKKIGEDCEDDGQCPLWDRINIDYQVTVTGSFRKCISNKCVCKANYHPRSDKLGCRKAYHGETCASASECFNSVTMDCSTTCKCKSTYPIVKTDKSGCRKAVLNEACPTATDCDSGKNLECVNSVCKCKSTHKKEENKGCRQFYVGEGSCTNDNQCKIMITGSVKCDLTSNTCKCTANYPIKDQSLSLGTYCRKVNADEKGCAGTSDSLTPASPSNHAACKESATMNCDTDYCKCTKVTDKPKGNGATCRRYYVSETGCANSGQCGVGTGATTTTCASQTCKCAPGHPTPVSSSSSTTCRKSEYHETCASTTDCASTTHFKCDGGKCVCDSAKKYWPRSTATTGQTASTACRKANYHEACTSTADCTSNTHFKCEGSKCVCDSAKKYWAKSTAATGQDASLACRKANLNSASESCDNDKRNCQASGAECTNNKCECAADRVQIGADAANKCDFIYVLGEACKTGQCYAGNLTCASSKCACGKADNQYDSVLASCKHKLAKYDEDLGKPCTHSKDQISNYNRLWYGTSNSIGGVSNSPVLRCAASFYCGSCPSVTAKTCKKYAVPIAPSSGNIIKMTGSLFIGYLTMLLI